MTRILSADVVWLPDGVLVTIGERLHVMVMGRTVTVFTDDDAEPAAPELAELVEPEPAQPTAQPGPERVKNVKALRVVCPSCGSSAGEKCLTESGKTAQSFHVPRVAAARGLS